MKRKHAGDRTEPGQERVGGCAEKKVLRPAVRRTVRIARQVTGLDEAIERREYDDVMPMMSRDLRFRPKALDVIGDSFPEMGIMPAKPDMRTLYTEEFLNDP